MYHIPGMNKSSLQSLTFLQLTKYTVQIPKYTVLIPFPFLTNTHINPYVPYPADEQEQFTKFDFVAVDNFSFLFSNLIFNFIFYVISGTSIWNNLQSLTSLQLTNDGHYPRMPGRPQTVSDNRCNSWWAAMIKQTISNYC